MDGKVYSLDDVLQRDVGAGKYISRDGNRGGLHRMKMSESKDNTLIHLITSSALVSHRDSITIGCRRYNAATTLADSLARSFARFRC